MSHSAMHSPLAFTGTRPLRRIYQSLDWLIPVADLASRLWVANAFLKSGLSKIQNFDSTIQLFTYEYQVPLLPPELAAYLGTATELSFPLLVALGLLCRPSAAVLFVFNLIAVTSYPAISLFTAIDHQAWALLLLLTVAHGPGRLSLDYLFSRRWSNWPV